MKRCCLAITFLAALLLAAAAHAQMGMDMFKRPTITKVFHPVVGKGAAYLSTDKDGKTRNSEISIVGKDSVAGKEGFWMEFSCEHWRNDKNNADSWTSDKITPFGLVKETHLGGGMVLTKVLDNATDRITGPVKQFDMQQMIQQMQQQRQQHPQP
jgi:hypothetical protein